MGGISVRKPTVLATTRIAVSWDRVEKVAADVDVDVPGARVGSSASSSLEGIQRRDCYRFSFAEDMAFSRDAGAAKTAGSVHSRRDAMPKVFMLMAVFWFV